MACPRLIFGCLGNGLYILDLPQEPHYYRLLGGTPPQQQLHLPVLSASAWVSQAAFSVQVLPFAQPEPPSQFCIPYFRFLGLKFFLRWWFSSGQAPRRAGTLQRSLEISQVSLVTPCSLMLHSCVDGVGHPCCAFHWNCAAANEGKACQDSFLRAPHS